MMEVEELVGSKFDSFVDRDNFDEFKELSQKLSVREKRQVELIINTPKNNKKVLSMTITPQLDEKREKIIGSFIIFKDITQIKHLIEELKSAREAAEEAYEIIEKRNQELKETNDKLKKSEVKLSEMNEILMEYIKATDK